ncbi:hypothetical protein GCM10009740_22790 [Terrabacter terrae]|uniref:Uncharacterized protein n=1 Tax=Terrabacter terrae TaxID=318434 RepID=A0ABN2UBI8_9MICO
MAAMIQGRGLSAREDEFVGFDQHSPSASVDSDHGAPWGVQSVLVTLQLQTPCCNRQAAARSSQQSRCPVQQKEHHAAQHEGNRDAIPEQEQDHKQPQGKKQASATAYDVRKRYTCTR